MTITVSYSELDTFRQCPFKHQLAYKERWVAPTTSGALARGTLWHAVLETHYRYLKEAQETWAKNNPNATLRMGWGAGWMNYIDPVALSDRINPFFYDRSGEFASDDAELIYWMYAGHVEHWGYDPQWKVLAVEHAPEIWLPTDRGGRSQFKLKLKIDLVVKEIETGRLWIVDHKSGRDLPNGKELDIDDQFGLYCWALRKMEIPVFGAIHNGARTQRNKDQQRHPQALEDRFRRTMLFRTDQELDNIAKEAYLAAKRAYAIRGDADRAPNPDTCRWRCDYTDACLFGRKTDNDATRSFLSDSGFRQNFERH